MKFSILKDSLLDGLQKVLPVISTRSTLPVLYNVHFKADQDKVWLTATDLDITIRTAVEAKVSRAGEITLPAKRLFSIVKELPVNEIEIDVGDDLYAKVQAGASYFKLVGISAEDFPPLPKLSSPRTLTINQGLWKTMLKSVHYAASSDESRPMLNGVLLSAKGGKLVMVATDGRRMAMWEEEFNITRDLEVECTIPNNTVHELLTVLKDDGPMKVSISDKQIEAEREDLMLVSKLVDHMFPNYRQVIPSGAEYRVTLEREAFLGAVRRASLLISEKTGAVTLNFSKNHLEVYSISAEAGEAKEKLAVKYSGKDIAISFNPEYLMDPLRNITSEEVSFEFSDEMGPCTIKTDKPFLYVLMPMRNRP